MKEVSITIPIYNEEGSIGNTVKNLVRVFKKNKVDYQLVLVSHGSKDNSDDIIKKLGRKNRRIKPLILKKNREYGGGIMYGFEHSDGKCIGWTCADEEVSAEDTYKIYAELKKNKIDVVKALRKNRKDGFFRIITTKIFNGIISIRFNLKIKDVNGYPLFMSLKKYRTLNIKETGPLFNLDLLREIKSRGYSVSELEVEHIKRIAGKSSLNLMKVIKMALRLINYSIKSLINIS